MKTICIGDIHGRSIWRKIVEAENPDKVFFIGDYFDSFTISGAEQIANFKAIIDYKIQHKEVNVILLLGNHDIGYFNGVNGTSTSGYQHHLAPSINQVLEENKHHLQMAYQMDEFLFTHAGVSPLFMNEHFDKWNVDTIADDLNDLWKYKPSSFEFNGLNSYGDDMCQTPVWIRPRSLMNANKKKEIENKYIQVVGHTGVENIDIKDRYCFIDTFSTSGEYLIITDGVVSVNKII